MKKYIAIAMLMAINIPAISAQTAPKESGKTPQDTTVYAGKPASRSGKAFDVVEQMPSFPGGFKALKEYLNNNMRYPDEAAANKQQGRVLCTFTVEPDGSINDIGITKSVSPSLDAEAMRVVSAMPRWIPGKQAGKPVSTKYTLPITFRLQGDSVPKTKPAKKKKENEGVTEMASFPGGKVSLLKYLKNNLKYPPAAKYYRKQGRVVCTFTVVEDGSITNIKVAQSIDPALDKEAVRVIKAMPRWNPAKENGVPVKINYFLPINFSL